MKTLFLIFIFGVAAGSVVAGDVTITLPTETAILKPGKGAELAQANCLICHSADYISSQPPMPRKFWEGAVKKMVEKYAAPVTPEVTASLVEYLAVTYGVPEAGKP